MREIRVCLLFLFVVSGVLFSADTLTFTDDFERADGPLTEWFQVSATTQIEAGQLMLTADGGGGVALLAEEGQPVRFDEVSHIEFEIAYPGDTAAWPYDHGGIVFCAQTPEGRYGTSSCYVIDYIALDANTPEVGRFRLGSFSNGAEGGLTETAADITSYEGLWEIDITDTTITFTFDGVEQFSWEDARFRGGYIGFWCYNTPIENTMTIDNLQVDYVPGECPMIPFQNMTLTMDSGSAYLPISIPFGSNETEAYSVTVTSSDPGVAVPAGNTNGSVDVTFEAGALFIQDLEIQPIGAGTAELSVTVDGAECEPLVCAVNVSRDVVFTYDFTGDPDGFPENWVVTQPNVVVEAEELVLTPGPRAEEAHVYAGDASEGIFFHNISTIEFDLFYTGEPAADPFDHGGVLFCCENLSGRYSNTGYFIDYLRGNWRLMKSVAGTHTTLVTIPNITEYEGRWKIVMDNATITFLLNGVEQFSHADADFRSGYVGFWAYTNAGQEIAVDNFEVVSSFSPCPAVSPLAASVVLTMESGNESLPVMIPLGANDTENYVVTVTSLDPTVAVPAGHTDGSLDITFAPGDSTVRNIEVEPVGKGETTFALTVEGVECDEEVTCAVNVLNVVSFEEEFVQPDGPPEGWYVAAETVQVIDEALSLSGATGPFCWYAINSDPVYVGKMQSVSCDIRFAQVTDAIGAHGGLVLAPEVTTARALGYMIDVIEREQDNGFRIYKDNNATVQLSEGGVRPPYVWDDQWHRWKMDFTVTGFVLSIDEEEIAVVNDLTYRGGYLAFWCYTNSTQNMFVDNISIDFGVSPCPSISPSNAASRPVNAPVEFTVSMPYGSNLNDDYVVTVTSTDPSVAVPTGSVDGVLTLTFPQGDEVLTQTFTVESLTPGTTDFVLSVDATSCPSAVATFTVLEPGVESFCDTFDQADGPPDNWTIFDGDWQVISNRLTINCLPGLANNEGWAWAGNPAERIEGVETMSFTMDLVNETGDAVGAHGGFMFCAGAPGPDSLTNRWSMSGYEIDWIDRVDDHGYRMIRSDNGTHTLLAGPTFDQFELGTDWRVTLQGEFISFYVDDELVFEVVDDTYREGYFGFWAYGNGTVAEFDDLSVGTCEVIGDQFIRGDVNVDDSVNIADAVTVLSYLFGGLDISCQDAADTNDDGSINIADAVKLLSYLFAGGDALPPPFDSCGVDPEPQGSDGLGCDSYEFCE